MDWSDKLRTGVEVIDAQHQGIFAWFKELEEATTERRTLFAAYAVTRLSQYVRDHFAIEEGYLRDKGYPRLEEHLAEHEAFRAKLRELKMKAISDDVVTQMVELLRAWLTNHIANSDMDYARFIKQLEKEKRKPRKDAPPSGQD